MAQGEATKEECRETQKAVSELFDALPKSKRGEYIGHLNDISLFLAAAEKVLPAAMEKKGGE
jgi:hypothetical protein